jgi:hypothetical protein
LICFGTPAVVVSNTLMNTISRTDALAIAESMRSVSGAGF